MPRAGAESAARVAGDSECPCQGGVLAFARSGRWIQRAGPRRLAMCRQTLDDLVREVARRRRWASCWRWRRTTPPPRGVVAKAIAGAVMARLDGDAAAELKPWAPPPPPPSAGPGGAKVAGEGRIGRVAVDLEDARGEGESDGEGEGQGGKNGGGEGEEGGAQPPPPRRRRRRAKTRGGRSSAAPSRNSERRFPRRTRRSTSTRV